VVERRWGKFAVVALLLSGLLAAPAAAAAPEKLVSLDESEIPGQAVEFELKGSNGYSLFFSAYSEPFFEGGDGRSQLSVAVFRQSTHGLAAYRVPAIVSDSYVKADLGPFGRVDLVRRPSGRKRTTPIRCSGGDTFTYEPALYEGIVQFRGERGYTKAEAMQVRPLPLVTGFCGSGSGKGESRGSDERGARLVGTSFAHGRALRFQFNKNHPRGRVPFSVELRERRDEVSIYRLAEGWLPAPSFRYDPDLKTATLGPTAPFTGSATLKRVPNSVPPLWSGDLAIELPGRKVSLAGAGVNVSLAHACFQIFDKPEASSC
jgi:hypothetical protein